jgi:imidazolonepropionase-like amidohydrolase
MSPREQDRRPLDTDGSTLVVHGAQVMDAAGGFSPATVTVVDGVVASVDRSPRGLAQVPAPSLSSAGSRGAATSTLDVSGLWLMPGVVDCHTHLGWTTFLPVDDDASASLDPAERARARLDQVAPGLGATLRAGVTSVRDAGGAEAAVRDAVASGGLRGPRVQTAVATVTDELARDPEGLRARVRGLVDAGADWIKVVATGGVMAPDRSEDESPFDERDLRAVVDEAAGLGVRVMVHAWGGDALTHAITAGVASVEHGMFLTERQAAAGAEQGVVLVPTIAIYSEVAEMARRGELPERVRGRAERVVEAHPRAVGRALEAGMVLALGSDFGTTEQHGRNLVEVDHLARAGLGAAGALVAATQAGARLLGDGTGVIEPGQRFDAVLLSRDPSDTAVLRDPAVVARVFLAGSTAV